MARHLHYNPGRDSVAYLDAINHGENRLHILEQLLIALRGEIGRPNHQHHLLIGPRGSGKTHLLRILTAGRISEDAALAAAYLPVVMPEETPLRSPGDLLLKFVERLADQLKEQLAGISPDAVRKALGVCLSALTTAKGMKDPMERLELMAGALDSAAGSLGRILLPIAENIDQTFYLGAQRSRKGTLDEQWAIRRYLQASSQILIIGAAPTLFGAVGDPGKPFYDFFRTHTLNELSNDESLEIIRLRLAYEATHPGTDELRTARVRALLDDFEKKSPQLRGLLVITGGLPRFIHLVYEVIVETDVASVMDNLNNFLDDMTPYFQSRFDPRIIPQPEIDVLHMLALARGPLQPTELAAELYGVSTNEVSELLNRLQERGTVKRSGRPGGQAVTWDLTEPLFRVWTQFRDNPDAQDLYHMLGKLVAMLFTLPEIETERAKLADHLSCLPESAAIRYGMRERDRVLEKAMQCHIEKQPVIGDISESVGAEAESPTAIKARELFNAHYDALEAGDQAQAWVLLDELRRLSVDYPDDVSVREQLAMGLVNAIHYAGELGDQTKVLAFLDELRRLSAAYPDDASVRKGLAMGLFNAFNDARKSGEHTRAQALLDELRRLSTAYRDDASVREQLAKGLFNAFDDAGESGDHTQAQTLLDELRQLSSTYPDDVTAREALAKGFFNTIYDAGKSGEHTQAQALLDELRCLSTAYRDDSSIREQLAMGLVNAIAYAGKSEDQTQALLDELRRLSTAYPDDDSIREKLAKGLFNAFINDANNDEQSQTLLYESLDVTSRCPDETFQQTMQQAVLHYSILLLALIKSGEAAKAREGMRRLTLHMPGKMAEWMHPVKLVMDVLEKGEEQALAREPEEVRRVVRMVLEKLASEKS